MKTKSLIFAYFITFIFNSFGQNNPVENLTWSHWYEYPNNYFNLQWDEPAQPHNVLIGYNIYRNDELYRFQTENTVYNFYSYVYGHVSNCGEDFLAYGNGGGFNIHVTAVYNPGEVESGYLQSYDDPGALLTTTNFIQKKGRLFPNPTNGVLHIANENLEKIVIYDTSGKTIREFAPASQIDLSSISKGMYIIKLFSKQEIIVDKIVID